MKKIISRLILFTLLALTYQNFIFPQTWVRKVDGFSMWSIGKDYAGNVYAGTTGSNRGIFKSSDGGESWTNTFSTGASNYLDIACDSLNNVYVANASNGMLKSTDGGQNYTLIPSSIFDNKTLNTVACGRTGHIFAGATTGGIWRSTDFGATFTNTALQTYSIVSIQIDRFNPDIIYAGASSTSANGFFISTDGGLTFSASTNSINVWQILQTSSNVLYTATTSSPYPFDRSTDGGLTWSTMSNQPGAMRGATLDLLEDIYIAGNGGVFKSTDAGTSFNNHNLTFSSNKIIALGNKIMVCVSGTTNGGVWIFEDATIPVELISFTGYYQNGKVILNWATASETNNQGFEIQKLEATDQWKSVGFVNGNGSSTSTNSYSFSDNVSVSGTYHYRLKQIDYDGSYDYSPTISVQAELIGGFELFGNYPNPFNPATRISYKLPEKSYVSIVVFDVIGNVVMRVEPELKDAGFHETEFTFSANNSTSGIYFYKIAVRSESGTKISEQTGKMMLLK